MSTTFTALPPSLIRKNLIRTMQAGLVCYIQAPPAVGKTDIIRSIAAEFDMKLLDMRLSQHDVADLNGLPDFTKDGRAYFAPFTNFPLEGDPLPLKADGSEYQGWIISFDELSSANRQMQAAAFKILLEREVGLRKLHPRVMMVCAGNREQDNGVTHTMSTPLQSRLIHLEMRVDHGEWMDWAVDHGIDARILGFLEFKADLLHKFDPQHDDKTFPAPRTWEFAHKLIQDTEISNADLPLLAGTVGAGAAQEFIHFCQVYAELAKVADILKNPSTIQVPEEPSAKYAMTTHLVGHCSTASIDAIATYIERFPVEFKIVFLRNLNRTNAALVRHRAMSPIFRELSSYL
ncbi:MAG: hypothetical protein ACOH2T_19085 [Pseudomonas sp.]